MLLIYLFLSYFFVVLSALSQAPIPATVWNQHCTKHSKVINDCNWCWCNEKSEYICNAKVCTTVDMLGHFKDSIKELHVGMEGHGAWRSKEMFCEPGVHYKRNELLCVCTEDGYWPNPVCRDIFRVLHPVKEIHDLDLDSFHTCIPYKLYLISCNVCICNSKGEIDPAYCTNDQCYGNEESERELGRTSEEEEIYAQCDTHKKYVLGCKECDCLRNNRLHCKNCTADTICFGKIPGSFFKMDCKTCYCDKKGYVHCTDKKCSENSLGTHKARTRLNNNFALVTQPERDLECIPGTKYKKDCNICYCYKNEGVKKIACTMTSCNEFESTCIVGTVYEEDCLICQCFLKKGVPIQICQENPKCKASEKYTTFYPLDGFCKPYHIYRKDCNTCQCMSKGTTMACTTRKCDKKQDIYVDIIPVAQDVSYCPKGHSYKIDCNYCFCIDHGNALCTTRACDKL